MAYFEAKNVPLAFTDIDRSYLFMSVSSTLVRYIAEALFTRISSPPKCLTVYSIASFTLFSSLMSQLIGKHYPPAFLISSAAV